MKRITDITELCVEDVVLTSLGGGIYTTYRVTCLTPEYCALLFITPPNVRPSYYSVLLTNLDLQKYSVFLERLSLFNKDLKEILG